MVDGAAPADLRPVVMAAIAGAHGIAGAVHLKLFAPSLAALQAHKTFIAGGRPLTLTALHAGPRGAIARFAEIGDRNAAEALRGQLLAVPRASLPPLPPGEYYWHDLLTLPVIDENDEPVGFVRAVENYGASDLLDIELPDGRRVLVPLTAEAVPEFDATHIRVQRCFVDAG